MFTTLDKTIASLVVSWLANECMIYFHVAMPGDLQTGLAAVIVAAIVWITPNVEKAIAKGAAQPPAPPAAPSAATKAVILLAILVLGTMAFATPSFAQVRKPHITGKPIEDIQADVADANGGTALGSTALTSALAKPFQDLASFLSSDAAAAVTLSTQIPALQDGNGQQCWMAMSTAGDVFKAHPVPLTLKVMTDVEALRLLAMTANNLCSNVHCTQVFADLTSMAQAASPVPLPIPGLHDLCSKIPQIAQVAPITAPATPSAAPKP